MISADGIDAITFDFFNTLVYHRSGRGRGSMLLEYLSANGFESDSWEHQVLYDVFERHGIEYSPDQSAQEKHRYLRRFAERVFDRLNVGGGNGVAADHAADIWRLLGPGSLAVFTDVPDALRRLTAAGYRLAVVSNWQCGLRSFCVELGLGDVFEHVIASAEIGYAKPSREIFEEACRRLAVPPGRVLHIGDSVSEDVEGARGAGLHAVLISRDGDAQEFEGPAVRSLEGVMQLLGVGPG
ncbi:MAG: HAD family hydrolase [Gemmatimonadota bacterium]